MAMPRLLVLFLFIGIFRAAWGQDSIYVCTNDKGILRYDLPTHAYVKTGLRVSYGAQTGNQDLACSPSGVLYGTGDAYGADYVSDTVLLCASGEVLYYQLLNQPVRKRIGYLPRGIAGDICLVSPTVAYYSTFDNHIYKLNLGSHPDTLLGYEDLGKVSNMGTTLGLLHVSLTGCDPRDAFLCFSPYEVGLFDPKTGRTVVFTHDVNQIVLGAAANGPIVMEDPFPELLVSNIVTDNYDGVNGNLSFSIPPLMAGFELRIVNQYGREVYVGQDPNQPWPSPGILPGVYFYTLTAQTACMPLRRQKGWVEVVR